MNLTSNRMSALAGLGYVVLALIGNFIAGAPPKATDTAATTAAWFADHHKAILVGAVLTGLAAPLFVWCFATLCRQLRKAGEASLSVITFGLVVAGIAIATVSDAGYASLAHAGRQGDGGFVKSGYDLVSLLETKALWFAAFAAVAVWLGSKSLAAWYRWIALLAAVLCALGGLAVKHQGFFGTFGGMTLIGYLALLVWVLATSAVLWATPDGA